MRGKFKDGVYINPIEHHEFAVSGCMLSQSQCEGHHQTGNQAVWGEETDC